MSDDTGFIYHNPTKILCGHRALSHLPFELNQIGVDQPLVLADDHTPASMIRRIIAVMRGSGITLVLHKQTPANPDRRQLDHLMDLFLQNRCDALVAAGRDEVVNTAKILALGLSDPASDPKRFAGRHQIPTELVPRIQIPCGPYSHLGALPLVQTPQWEAFSPYLLPDLAILDTKLNRQPRSISRFSSVLMPLCGCIESAAGRLGNPVTDSMAMAGISCCMQYLTKILTADRKKRDDSILAYAQIICGCVVAGSKPGILFQLAEELFKQCGLDRGILCGILLPHLLEIFARRHPLSVAQLLRVCTDVEQFAMAADTLIARGVINVTYTLMQRRRRQTAGEVPTTLAQADISWKCLKRISQMADSLTTGIAGWDKHLCLELFSHAWQGIPIAISLCECTEPTHQQ